MWGFERPCGRKTGTASSSMTWTSFQRMIATRISATPTPSMQPLPWTSLDTSASSRVSAVPLKGSLLILCFWNANLWLCDPFFYLQASVQDVLWRSVSSDATALPQNEWLSQQLLGLGRRGWWHRSQVRTVKARSFEHQRSISLWCFESLFSDQMVMTKNPEDCK